MDFSISATGIQSASSAFESAANGIPKALSNATNDILSAGSTISDSVDLSTAVASLAKKNLDFSAKVTLALVDNASKQSTFSILG